MKGYFWGKGDRPTKKDDHSLDELRYYIMSRPESPKFEKKKTEVEKDKERLIRKLDFSRKTFGIKKFK